MDYKLNLGNGDFSTGDRERLLKEIYFLIGKGRCVSVPNEESCGNATIPISEYDDLRRRASVNDDDLCKVARRFGAAVYNDLYDKNRSLEKSLGEYIDADRDSRHKNYELKEENGRLKSDIGRLREKNIELDLKLAKMERERFPNPIDRLLSEYGFNGLARERGYYNTDEFIERVRKKSRLIGWLVEKVID